MYTRTQLLMKQQMKLNASSQVPKSLQGGWLPHITYRLWDAMSGGRDCARTRSEKLWRLNEAHRKTRPNANKDHNTSCKHYYTSISVSCVCVRAEVVDYRLYIYALMCII